ncbi:MAG: hypothetical protein U1D64_02795, partial [Bacteroidales bacterium]|nr:hypothetical protein [Bacteroidales bacterium]
ILGVISDMKRKGITLSGIISQIESYHNSGEINFKIERKKEAMDLIRDHFISKERATAQYDFDGYRVEFPDWWFNIRPSNTEPYLRFIAEASSKQMLDDRVSKVKELLESGGFFK